MRSLCALAISLFLLGAAPDGAAQWTHFATPLFVRVDTSALPHPDVRRVAVDGAGFLWVGTPGGLARFDGYEFLNFQPNPADPSALPDGWIRALAADPNGGLWIGTESSGLVRFDQQTQTFHTWRPVTRGSSGPLSTIVSALIVAPDKTLWLGGDRGIDHFDPATQRFSHAALKTPRQRDVQAVMFAYDAQHVLWAATNAGLFYRSRSGAFVLFHPRGQWAAGPVWNVYEDSLHRLWALSPSGVYAIDRARRNAVRLPVSADDPTMIHSEHTGLIEPVPGTLWIGTASGLITSVDLRTMRVMRIFPDIETPGGLARGELWQFQRDPSGLIWIAKGIGGLGLYNPASRGLHQLSTARRALLLPQDGPTAVTALDARRFVAAGVVGGAALVDAAGGGTNIASHEVWNAYSAFTAPDGSAWLGGRQGLCRLARGSVRLQCPAGPPEVANLRVDAIYDDGRTLWIGSQEGLFVEDERSGAVRVYAGGRSRDALTNRWVTSLLRDRDGRMWAGTQAGLNRIDTDGHVTRFAFDPSRSNALSPGVVDALLQDRHGRIWAGTIGGQLNVLEPDGRGGTRITHLGVVDGLPHDNVDGLVQDARGRIWASTPRGVAVFEPGSFRARGFGTIDGVSSGAYHAGSVGQAGNVAFFGGFDGVTVVDGNAASPWDYSPPLVIDALSVAHRSMSPWDAFTRGATLDLGPGRHDLTVEFAALDYSGPAALRYAYQLEGYDRQPIQTDAAHRLVTYTNLPPGHYTLVVRATNRLGRWSDRTLNLRIDAIPAWYETWWFRGLLALLIVLALLTAHQSRTALLHRRQRELEAIVEARTRELAEMSLTDPLTGLRNRRFLMQYVESEVALAVRLYRDWQQSGGPPPEGADLLFFIIDVDEFKSVNDELGHAAGDRVLAQMRERMRSVFRETDYLVRWGGEEFLAIARHSRRSEAPELAERMRAAVANHPFQLDGDAVLHKTASVGFAAFPFCIERPDALSWLAIVELADEALYTAKGGGRNRWAGVTENTITASVLACSLSPTAETILREGAFDTVDSIATV